jgi:hypothetical protein
MCLFKFVPSKSAVLNMAKGSLKFTPINQLNDPSEMIPVMDDHAVRSSLQSLRADGLTTKQFQWLRHQSATLDLLAPEKKILNVPKSLAEANRKLASKDYDDFKLMQKEQFDTINIIRERVGILSLSDRFDSLPMWAHYADLAKGFVVRFDNLKRSFPGDKTGSLNIPKPVTYRDRLPGMTFDPSTQDHLFFSKLSDWSYEREWRVVTALSACRLDGSLYLRDVLPDHMTGVICGWRADPEDVKWLRKELTRVNSGASLVSAFMDGDGRVRLP